MYAVSGHLVQLSGGGYALLNFYGHKLPGEIIVGHPSMSFTHASRDIYSDRTIRTCLESHI